MKHISSEANTVAVAIADLLAVNGKKTKDPTIYSRQLYASPSFVLIRTRKKFYGNDIALRLDPLLYV